jgi:glycine/sarcosine/betaine reductase complex component A
MDSENQALMKRLAEEHGKDNLVVVLGAADPEGVEISAETLTLGDPSFAGPLAGVPLGLHVYHILEPEFKQIIPEAIYQEKLGIFELTSDGAALGKALSKIREQAKTKVDGG